MESTPSLSILQLVIFAIVIGLVVGAVLLFARAFSNREPQKRSKIATTPGPGPSGLGGWLMLLTILVFAFPVITLFLLVVMTDFFAMEVYGKIPIFNVIPTILYVLLFILQCCTAFFMARRTQQFVPFYRGTVIVMILFKPVSFLLSVILASMAFGGSFGHALAVLASQQLEVAIILWILISIGLIISILYVNRSHRVANTFVR